MNQQTLPANGKKNQYTPEFKQQAVQLALSGEQPQAKTAERLGVKLQTLQAWIKQHRQQEREKERLRSHGIEPLTPEEKEELKRLRRENRQLQLECEILKKAALILGRPPQ